MAKKKDKNTTTGEHLLPEGICIRDLVEYYEMADNEYATIRKQMVLLDGADTSELWKTISAKFPKYQILPETNYVNYIKENLVASIYTVGKYAELLPKAESQIQTCNVLNRVLDSIWETAQVSKYQRKAGERAALLNLGVTQIGWDKSVVGGTEGFLYKGDITLKNIDPLKYMRDPYADCLDNGRFACVWDDYHITSIRNTPAYAERIKELEGLLGKDFYGEEQTLSNEAPKDRATSGKSDEKYRRVVTYWVKYIDDKNKLQIAEVHLMDKRYILSVNPAIEPATFPIAELYCNEPGSSIIGKSEPAKIFKNYVTYNMVHSIVATHAYKSQRPPRFVNIQSGINLRQFAKYGADADKTFPVNGDASQAVHYGRFPDLPATIDTMSSRLEFDIKDKSGINEQYAGQATNSIQTTGGMDAMIERVTGRDEVKIQLYEEYTKRITELVIQYYIKYGNERTYTIKEPTGNEYKDVKINFKDIPNKIGFAYSVNIQSELPKNKARLAQAANILLEKQAQYKPNPEIITMEEWLLMQDIPFKDLINSRLKIQRSTNMTEQVTSILFEFAGLIEQGATPDEALQLVTQSAQAAQTPTGDMMPGGETPAMGNQASAGSFQQMQAAPQQSFQ